MRFEYNPCKMKEIAELQRDHVSTLTAPVDTYLDSFVFASQFYTIHIEGTVAGFFAIDGTKMLTQFHLTRDFVQYASTLFQDIVEKFSISSALVPTCDELLYDVVLDQFSQIEKEGFFFQDANKTPSVVLVSKFGSFREGTVEDIPKILAISGTFFDKLEQRIQHQEIFILNSKETLLGVGIIEKSRLLPGYVSIGMFVNPRHRHKGVGSTIIAQLKNWCYTHDLKPMAGCAYENVASKRTLEKAGMISKTQLFKVHF